jgi:hypothetical protein
MRCLELPRIVHAVEDHRDHLDFVHLRSSREVRAYLDGIGSTGPATGPR